MKGLGSRRPIDVVAIGVILTIIATASIEASGQGQYVIPMGGEAFEPDVGVSTVLPAPPTVIVVQFYERPTPGIRADLELKGIHVLDALHGTAFFARVDSGVEIEDTVTAPAFSSSIRAVFAIEPEDKIAPVFYHRPSPMHLSAGPGLLRAMVLFQREFPASGAAAILSTSFAGTHSRPYSIYDPPRVWLVTATRDQLLDLAQSHEVRWVRPPPAGFTSFADQLMQTAGIRSVQHSTGATYQSLLGAGVRVGVFDCPPTTPEGKIHADLFDLAGQQPRVAVQHEADDWCGMCRPSEDGFETQHGDWVMGLIGGNGWSSAADPATTLFSFDGVLTAPLSGAAGLAKIDVYPPRPDRGARYFARTTDDQGSLRLNPVSNHSYLTGALVYDDYSRVLDRATLGRFDEEEKGVHGKYPQVVVAAVGNSGTETDTRLHCSVWSTSDPECDVTSCIGNCGAARGYFSVFAPSKNAIVVGAAEVGATDGSGPTLAAISSMGPTPDGRVKPDLIAPACRVDLGAGSPMVLAHLEDGTDGYEASASCGTSFAAATTTGAVSLLIELWDRIKTTGQPSNLWPSTYKASLVAGARETQRPPRDCSDDFSTCVPDTPGLKAFYSRGPDYATGFGVLNLPAASRVIRERLFTQGTLLNAEPTFTKVINVEEGVRTLRIVLAWDDPGFHGARRTSALVHDLDVRVRAPEIGPLAGAWFGPWVPPVVDWNPNGRRGRRSDGACGAGYDGIDDLDFGSVGYFGPGIPPAIRCVKVGRVWRDVDSGIAIVTDDGEVLSRPYDGKPVEDDRTGKLAIDPRTCQVVPEDPILDRLENSCRDARNNVEMVEIDFPVPGSWTIEVSAVGPLVAGSQDFSLAWQDSVAPLLQRFPWNGLECMDVDPFTSDWERGRLRVPLGTSCFRVRLRDACARFPSSALCLPECDADPCPEQTLAFDGWPEDVAISIVHSDGTEIGRSASDGQSRKVVRFVPKARTHNYLIVHDEETGGDPGGKGPLRRRFPVPTRQPRRMRAANVEPDRERN